MEQLKQEYEKNTVLLEREKRKMQRLKNRQAYLESGSRKQRTHRLITRGAAVESIALQTKELSEAEFYSLMENILNLPQAEHFIRVRPAELTSAADKISNPRSAFASLRQGGYTPLRR
ncbi:DUF3847 domain-containing protein [Blautia wexlerae]|uniref:DUF3847 domain-containing protein n=1 Tax=Blautia wexlerae TaxID=418240 RepID=UPI003B500B5C